MLKNIAICSVIAGCVFSSAVFAEPLQIAITIDDLPFVGSSNKTTGDVKRAHDRFMRIYDTLMEYKIPTTGFVIAGSIGKNQWELLELFQKNGLQLGNHTYSHRNLNTTSTEKYIEDLDKADKILTPVMSNPKYFRYPYLAEGKADKKAKVRQYLSEHGYSIAPVTIDSKDYLYNSQLLAINWRQREQKLNPIKQRYLAYIAKQTERAEQKAAHSSGAHRQILLIHANLLNSFCLKDILDYYQQRGYSFISLEEALQAPAPAIQAPAPEEIIPN